MAAPFSFMLAPLVLILLSVSLSSVSATPLPIYEQTFNQQLYPSRASSSDSANTYGNVQEKLQNLIHKSLS
jgi:hypothetical protein